MRVFLLLWVTLNVLSVQAQFAKKIAGPIQTRKGITLKEGDTLTLGKGSNYDGAFRYLQMGLDAGSTANDPLPAHYARKSFPIKLFREVQTGQETKLYASLKAGTLYTTFAEIEAAIDAKELIGVNSREIGRPRTSSQTNTGNALATSNTSGGANSSAQETMTVKQFSNDVNVKILSIEGNKSQQTVTVVFMLRTELPHQQVGIMDNVCNWMEGNGEGKAYDGDGTEYNLKTTSLGSIGNAETAKNKLPTSVPLKGSITFSNVLPKINVLSFITFFMTSRNYDGGQNCQRGNVEIRNAKVDWK